jgi:hypothetical protein
MATVFGSAQWRMVDYQGVQVSKIIYFETSDASTVAQIVADLTAEAALLDAVTDAATTGIATLSISFGPTGLKTTPVQGNPMGEGILSTFSQTGVPLAFSDLVPAAKSAIITNGHVIETPGGAYDLYRASFLAPLAHITLGSNDLRTLSAFRRNKLNTRKHRRGQSVATTEE